MYAPSDEIEILECALSITLSKVVPDLAQPTINTGGISTQSPRIF
jgi:hypothetical protein